MPNGVLWRFPHRRAGRSPSANRAHDVNAPAAIFLSIDLGGAYIFVTKDNASRFDAESLPDLGRRRVTKLMGMPRRDTCLLACALNRLAVAGDGVTGTRDL